MKSQLIPYERELESLEAEHPTLGGGIAFVEGAATWGASELVGWFETHLVGPGRMGRPTIVSDPAVGTAPLVVGLKPRATRPVRLEDVPSVCAAARQRVVEGLRAFIGSMADDRFLQAAIFGDRVRRVAHEKRSVWVASPRETDALANIALSLFAADILSHREFYEMSLCVCEVCGRVSFHPEITGRTACSRHPPRTESTSGFQVTATPTNGTPKDKR